MMNNTSELIDKLKKGAVDRCRERIIEARENPKEKSFTIGIIAVRIMV